MAGSKVTQFDLAAALTGAEIFGFVQAGGNVQGTLDDLTTFITAEITGGSATLELIRDTIGSALVAGTGITITVNDPGDTITIAITEASAANIQAGTAGKVVTADKLHDAHAPQTLTDGATIDWNMAVGFNAKVTLGGNRTLAAPTNPKVGLTYVLEIIQDGTGTRLLTWNAAYKFGSAGTPTLSTGAGKRDFVSLYCYDAVTPAFRASFNKDS